MTRRDATRRDATRRDATRRDATRRDATRRDATRRDATRRDATRRDATRRDATRRDTTRHDTTTHDNLLPCYSDGLRLRHRFHQKEQQHRLNLISSSEHSMYLTNKYVFLINKIIRCRIMSKPVDENVTERLFKVETEEDRLLHYYFPKQHNTGSSTAAGPIIVILR